MPINKSDKSRRGMLWADVNGDKLPDLLVAEPESGQILIYTCKKPTGRFRCAEDFFHTHRRQ